MTDDTELEESILWPVREEIEILNKIIAVHALSEVDEPIRCLCDVIDAAQAIARIKLDAWRDYHDRTEKE